MRFEIFRDRNFLIACFFMVIMGLMLFSTMALATPFIQNIMGYPIRPPAGCSPRAASARWSAC